jgi:hypothetical protein
VWWIHAGVLGALVLLYQPDLAGAFQQITQMAHGPQNWDAQNSTIWQYLINNGHLPYRDFWFPYSGFLVQLFPFPVNALTYWLHAVIVLWLLYFGLYSLLRSISSTLIVFFIMLALTEANVLSGWSRYMLAIDLVLIYWPHLGLRISWRRFTVLALVAGYICFHEPTQMFYGLAALLTIVVMNLLREADVSCVEDMKAAGQAFLYRSWTNVVSPAATGALVALIALAAFGILPAFLRFHRSISVQAIYGAVPSDVLSWVYPILGFNSVYLFLFLLIGLAVHWELRRSHTAAGGLILLGVTGFLVVQKQIFRPHMMEQFQLYPILIILLVAALVWPRRNVPQSMVLAIAGGLLFGLLTYRSVPDRLFAPFRSAGHKLAGNWVTLTRDAGAIHAANAALYAPSRLVGFDAEKEVIRVLRDEYHLSARESIYVLGDDPIFYILRGQEMPYVITAYNASPADEQHRVLEWLQTRKPRFVLWDPSKNAFDRIPHTVRLPLLYRYVADNYGPAKVIGRYHIARLVSETGHVDPGYWSQQLGAAVDLGHIASLSNESDYPPCGRDNDLYCGDVLVVKYGGRVTPGKAKVALESAAGQYAVVFDREPDDREYIINLEHLWFWGTLKRFPGPRIVCGDADAQCIVSRRRAEALY